MGDYASVFVIPFNRQRQFAIDSLCMPGGEVAGFACYPSPPVMDLTGQRFGTILLVTVRNIGSTL